LYRRCFAIWPPACRFAIGVNVVIFAFAYFIYNRAFGAFFGIYLHIYISLDSLANF
jgi:hypothetical protein